MLPVIAENIDIIDSSDVFIGYASRDIKVIQDCKNICIGHYHNGYVNS